MFKIYPKLCASYMQILYHFTQGTWASVGLVSMDSSGINHPQIRRDDYYIYNKRGKTESKNSEHQKHQMLMRIWYRVLLFIAGAVTKWYSFLGKQFRTFYKTRHLLIIVRETENLCKHKKLVHMFIAYLFIIAKTWKKPEELKYVDG